MKNKKRSRKFQIKINLTNRWLYTLIAIGILAIVGVGVYAATYSNSGAGHPYTEISTCGTNGQILKMSGGAWTCVDMPSGVIDTRCDTSGTCSQVCIGTNCKSSWPSAGADSDWIISGNNMYSGVSGNVGIGTTSPTEKLHVMGNIFSGGNFRTYGKVEILRIYKYSRVGTSGHTNPRCPWDSNPSTPQDYPFEPSLGALYTNTNYGDLCYDWYVDNYGYNKQYKYEKIPGGPWVYKTFE